MPGPSKSKSVVCDGCGKSFASRGIASHRNKCEKRAEVEAANKEAADAMDELIRKRKRGECRFLSITQ